MVTVVFMAGHGPHLQGMYEMISDDLDQQDCAPAQEEAEMVLCQLEVQLDKNSDGSWYDAEVLAIKDGLCQV